MSLVTVLRSPSTSDSTSLATEESDIDEDQEDSSLSRSRASSFEGFFASKGAAYALPDGDFARRATKHGGEMQLHLQAMVNLLRDEDVLRLVIKLECQYPNRIRYLTIVSAFGPDEEEQSIIMGVDWTDKATIGLVVPLYRDTVIKLDGDGGFKMTSAEKTFIFKPISVQTMWTALQWIHKCSDNARKHNYYYTNCTSHAWVDYYYRKISSDRVCMNEWQQMDELESKRPESPIGTATEKELVKKLIRHKLKEVMMRVDLEEVTCRQIRNMLEEDTQMELKEYRSFIDEEMLTILGQMDSASKIFDHVYLGSEWNASNLEELKENGIGYILNITREIDNFFPGTFNYHNIRVYDLDDTELLHHWDYTYKFIQRAKNAGSKVLVHCRMGISRSASTVIAYGMKEYGWSLGDTMKYVKARRNVVQPNAGFWKQLITYEGILNSSKHRFNKIFRHGSFSSDAEELSKSAAGAVQKRKKEEQSQATVQQEVAVTANNFSKETESDSNLKEGVLPFDSEGTSSVAEDTTVNADNVFTSEGATQEGSEVDCVPAPSSPTAMGSNLMVESREEECVGTNSVRGSLEVSEIVQKSSLQRVSSVPSLSNDDHKGKELDSESTGKFRRSCSLRERGPRKLQLFQDSAKAMSASDENLKGFERKKREILDLEEIKNKECTEGLSSVVTKPQGSLLRDLDGVLESGFVKRHSRKFEGGVHFVPSVTLSDDVDPKAEEESTFELSKTDEDGDEITEDAEEQTFQSEEPEPGVVRKHKEGYELKYRESLKRRALLQRGVSEEAKTVKHEGNETEGEPVGDNDSPSLQAQEGEECGRIQGVLVEALVQKVNEDMKKTVSARKISASKKEQELRVFVQQAGEQMKEALDSVDDEPSKASSNNSLFDDNRCEEISDTCIVKSNSLKDKQEVLSKSTSAEPRQPVAFKNDSKSSTVTETSEVLDSGTDGGEDVENVLQRGLVKRHTLLIEGKLQQPEHDSEKERESQEEKESAGSDDREIEKELVKSEVCDASQEEVNSGCTLIPSIESTDQIIPVKAEIPESSKEREDTGSDQDATDIPARGLVKRHTLLIEGKLQPLDQELGQDGVKELGGKDQEASQWEGDVDKDRDQLDLNVAPDANISVEPIAEGGKLSDMSDAAEDKGSEQNTEDIPKRGLVKRHTLLIEGKIQPLDQQLDEDIEKEVKDGVVALENESIKNEDHLRYQIERPGGTSGDQLDEVDQDNKTAAGLVKRQKQRIEEKLLPAEEHREDREQELSGNETVTVEADDDGEVCQGSDEKVEDDSHEDQLQEKELNELGVDTSSVVKVKQQTQHLEGIIRVAHDGDKVKRQSSKEEDPKCSEQSPKVVIVPRSSSDETTEDGAVDTGNEERMEVLSDRAVNKALNKAQEKLDFEKVNLEPEKEQPVDWEYANVRQRTQIFETIMGRSDKDIQKDDGESENQTNSLRRHESMSKVFRASEKPAMRRRSVSDVTKPVSSGSDRKVGYTIQFKQKVAESSGSSSLPRDWSPFDNKHKREDKGLCPKVVFSSEIIHQGELKEKSNVELIDNQDRENQACQSIKETVQVLDSKNQKIITSN